MGAICDYDLSAKKANLDIPISRWNVIGKLVVPNLSGALDKLARFELDLELTLKLIELEHERRGNDEVWPHTLPGGDVSSACPQDRWVYDVSPEGKMTLAFNREITWPALRGLSLPTNFTIK